MVLKFMKTFKKYVQTAMERMLERSPLRSLGLQRELSVKLHLLKENKQDHLTSISSAFPVVSQVESILKIYTLLG